MSVTSALFTGVSGLLANAEGINVIGDNLANVNSIGFKSSRMIFSDILSTNINGSAQIGRGTQIQQVDTIYGQGSFSLTESVTDLAIQGSSFFAVMDPNATAPVNQNGCMLTRAGAFRLDDQLNLVNPDTYQVLDTEGNPIKFFDDGDPANDATNFSKITSIDPSGLITYICKDGITLNYYNQTGVVGVPTTPANALTAQRLAIMKVINPNGLEKAGGTLFRPTAGSGITAVPFTLAANSPNGISERIYTNSLEQSNVDMASQMVSMILTQRAYSANSMTITTADEMTQEALNLKR